MISGDVDAEEVGDLAWRMVRAASPNPPGGVNEVARVVTDYLDAQGLGHRHQRVASDRVNLVCTVESGRPGPHLVLSGHLDTFPHSAGQRLGRAVGPEGAMVRGRGIADMKGGVAGFLVVLRALSRAGQPWRGRVTAVLVCDEETFGPHGARRLLLDRSLLDVDAVLTAEPSGRGRIRHGERGPVWGTVTFTGPAGHAAYATGTPSNPIEQAAAFAASVRAQFARAFPTADSSPPVLPAPEALDASITVSTVHGGSKVNTHPPDCAVEVDVRVPLGVPSAAIVDWMTAYAHRCGGTYRCDVAADASTSDPEAPLFAAMREAVRVETGLQPVLETARGSTDGRLWRRHGVPVAQYGADPLMQATADERVSVHELGEIARVHARTAWTLLTDES